MANKKITELAVGTTPDGSELAEGVQGGVNKQFTFAQIAALSGGSVSSVNGLTGAVVLYRSATTAGTNTITATMSPPQAALANGDKAYLKITNTTTGLVTFNPSGLGAKKVFKTPSVQAGAGDLQAGQQYLFIYDTALDSVAGGYLIIGEDDYQNITIVSGSTYTFLDSDHKKVVIFTVNCTANFPTGLRADYYVDVYSIPTVTLVEFTATDTLEASYPYIRGGISASFVKRTSTIIAGVFGNGIPETFLVPTADTATSSNVAADITGLTMTVEANSRYTIDGFLCIGCNNTGGVKLGFITPSGTVYNIHLHGMTTGGTAYSRVFQTADGLSSIAFSTVNTTGASGNMYINGTITVSSTTGTFKLQFASGTNTQSSTIYRDGSYLRVTKIL